MAYDINDELLIMYAAEMPDRINAIRLTFESRDRAGLIRLAHQLAGSAGSYGFPTLSLRARRLEICLKEGGDLEECADRITNVIDMCEQVLQMAPRTSADASCEMT